MTAGKPASDEVALAGSDGRDLARLVRRSQAEGVRVLARLTRAAVERAKRGGVGGRLFTDEERKQLADVLASVVGTADLLARARVRELAARSPGPAFGSVRTFAEDPGLILAPPEKALDYFLNLVPEIGVDPRRWGEDQRRRAFTLAASTDEVLTRRVQEAIADAIREGKGSAGAADVDDILDAAGVGPRQDGYAAMVCRTNAMDAFLQASYDEMRSPDIADQFPAWQYLGIRDGRQGKDHEPKFDRYYPASASFAEVRGPRPFNCRCSMSPIDRETWAELEARGAKLETSW